MTKAEIVAEVAKKSGIEKAAVAIIVDEFMSTVKDAMGGGENVYLRCFGTFEIVERKEKTGRNITKNTSVIIPAHKIPKFKPCPEFKEMVK